MKNPQLMEELEKSIDDEAEKAKVMEGFLGYIICSTQVTSPHLVLDCCRHITDRGIIIEQQEAVVLPPFVAFAVRPHPGIWEYVKVHSVDLSVDGITPCEYLKNKETIYDEKWYMNSSKIFYV